MVPADNSGLVLNVNTKYGDGIKSTSDETADGKTYGNVTINGGTVNIVCEALNADTANSAGADGIQAEQSFVMNGEMDKYPEAAFLMAGTIDDVIAKAKQIGDD